MSELPARLSEPTREEKYAVTQHLKAERSLLDTVQAVYVDELEESGLFGRLEEGCAKNLAFELADETWFAAPSLRQQKTSRREMIEVYGIIIRPVGYVGVDAPNAAFIPVAQRYHGELYPVKTFTENDALQLEKMIGGLQQLKKVGIAPHLNTTCDSIINREAALLIGRSLPLDPKEKA